MGDPVTVTTLRGSDGPSSRKRLLHSSGSDLLYASRTGRSRLPGIICGVEVWRGGLGGTYRLPALSFAGASLARHASVSTPRSSNRTCGFAASGSRRRLTQSPRLLHVTPSATSENNLGVVRLIANLPFYRRFLRPPSTEAPSLHRSYPASSVLRASPPSQTARPFSHELPVDPYGDHRWDFPCCAWSPFACMPSPIPRQVGWNLFAHTIPSASAFPIIGAGRLLH